MSKHKRTDHAAADDHQNNKRQRLAMSLLDKSRQLKMVRKNTKLPRGQCDARQMMMNRALFVTGLLAIVQTEGGENRTCQLYRQIHNVLNVENWVDEFKQLRVFPEQKEVINNLAFCLVLK